MLKYLSQVVMGALISMSLLTATTLDATAQVAPTMRAAPAPQYPSAPPAPATATSPAPASDPGLVMLAEVVKPCSQEDAGRILAARTMGKAPPVYCQDPRPATKESGINETTPAMSKAMFLQYYPQMGEAGYNTIRAANKRLCSQGYTFMDELLQLDKAFIASDNAYADLQSIYEALPKDVKRNTRIMQISQAGATGALCLLSAGLYCIAAVLSFVGNLFASETNKRLQLANVRLSIENIVVTRLNIQSNRLTIRMDAFWLDLVVPYCEKVFPGMDAGTAGSFSGQFSPLPSLTQVTGRSGN